MKEAFKAAKIAENVYWVGAIDWGVRDFHGYLTSRGTTYNAYLVLAEKVTLIDTVKAAFKDELLGRIASVIEPNRIDYIVSNHSEPDHSGCLTAVMEAIQPQKVFASAKGYEALDEHFQTGGAITAVGDGESLSLGNMKLTFMETRMCHWPDSMVSYLHEAELLFSQDAFGMHLASYERFADELPRWIIDYEAAKYYANILLPLSNFIAKALDKVSAAGLAPRIIAPDHGPIWRTDPLNIVARYARWAQQARTNKAVIIYDTMWNTSDVMARAIAEGIASGGTHVKVMPLRGNHRSDVATELLDAGALVAGAPTINNEMYPTMADALSYIRGLRPKGLIGAVFGSFGWSGESTKALAQAFADMKIELVDEPLRIKYRPAGSDLEACYKLGQKISQRLSQLERPY